MLKQRWRRQNQGIDLICQTVLRCNFVKDNSKVQQGFTEGALSKSRQLRICNKDSHSIFTQAAGYLE
jgi:hypothetical protein